MRNNENFEIKMARVWMYAHQIWLYVMYFYIQAFYKMK